MTKTLDLITAIEAGQSMKIHSLFEELVNARLVEAIEQRRAEIADLVFNGPVVEEAQLDEEFVQEMSQYDLGDVIEFMLSEEFDSIDELSKTTLGNYVKKASTGQLSQKEVQANLSNEKEKRIASGDFKAAGDVAKKYNSVVDKVAKRSSNIHKAVDRITTS